MTVTTIDPSTGRTLATYEETNVEGLGVLHDRAHLATQGRRHTPLTERGNGLHRPAAALREHQEELASLATKEMGKPLLEPCRDQAALLVAATLRASSWNAITLVQCVGTEQTRMHLGPFLHLPAGRADAPKVEASRWPMERGIKGDRDGLYARFRTEHFVPCRNRGGCG